MQIQYTNIGTKAIRANGMGLGVGVPGYEFVLELDLYDRIPPLFSNMRFPEGEVVHTDLERGLTVLSSLMIHGRAR